MKNALNWKLYCTTTNQTLSYYTAVYLLRDSSHKKHRTLQMSGEVHCTNFQFETVKYCLESTTAKSSHLHVTMVTASNRGISGSNSLIKTVRVIFQWTCLSSGINFPLTYGLAAYVCWLPWHGIWTCRRKLPLYLVTGQYEYHRVLSFLGGALFWEAAMRWDAQRKKLIEIKLN